RSRWKRAFASRSARAAGPSAPVGSQTSSSSRRAGRTGHGVADARGQKIRIRLKAYDHEIIDQSTKKIVETVVPTQAQDHRPVPLPTQIPRFSLIRAPHVDNDSPPHF